MKSISKDIVEEITKRVVEEIKPKKLFLFGSMAWGVLKENSDLDLMVIVSEGQESLRSIKQRIRKSLKDIFIPIDIIVEPISLFERRRHIYASLECQVSERGINLYG